MPPVGIAMRIDLIAAPWMKKPPAAVKLLLWKWVSSSTMIVRIGMNTFHEVSPLFTRASQRMPIRLTTTKKNIRQIATTMPVLVSVPLLPL